MAIIGMAVATLLVARTIESTFRGGLKLQPVSVFTPLLLFLAYIFLQFQFWSVESHSTGVHGIIAFSCVTIIFLTANGSLSRKDVKRFVIAILVFGSFEAAYGLVQYLGGYEYIWNYRRLFGQGVASGTLINRNHYALLMNLFIAAAVGYLFYRTDRLLQGERFSPKKIAHLPGSGNLFWILLCIVFMGLALIFSMSRMGIAALFGSVAAMILAARAAYSKRRIVFVGLLLAFGIIGLALYTGVDEVVARYEAISDEWRSERDRTALWNDAWPLILERPLLGSGLGTFQWTYPAHESVRPDIPARYAHNDYIQALSEVGIVGLGLLLWAFGAVWRIAYRNFKNAQDPMIRGIGLGTIGMLTAIALQECTDFGLYIPGVSLTAALLAGLNLRVYGKQYAEDWFPS